MGNTRVMGISRRTWLFGSSGLFVAGALGLSLPGGGPRTYFGGIPAATDVAAPGTMFSPAEQRAELTWLVDTLREVGARPFAYASEAVFDKRYRATLDSLRDPIDARAAYLRFAPLIASLNDGHAWLLLGNVFSLYMDRGGAIFPLVLTSNEHGLFVSAQTDERLPRGSKVVAIEGVSGDDVLDRLIALTGGQHPSLRRAFAANRIASYCFATYGAKPVYRIDAVLPDGRTIRCEIEAITYERLDVATNRHAERAAPNYTFTRIADRRIGYIDYRRCVDAAAFHAFLESTFSSIKTHPVDGLVIDIRQNGGGDSSLNRDLWSFAQAKPFSAGGKVAIKVSSRLKREYGFAKYNEIYLPPSWLAPNGALLDLDFTRFASTIPGANPVRYNGPVYLLIGAATFSSAMLCALAAKDYGLATLVGEETGEPANSTGELYSGMTPRIGLDFGFTTKYFWAPKPHPDGQGVLPDVRIVPSEADLRAGRDPVLEYAVRRIVGA